MVILVAGLLVAGQSVDDAARALQAGNPAEAAATLTTILKTHPGDVQALVLMGVALDSQQQFTQAAPYYDRALRLAPDSAPVLNNAANHYMASGDRASARRLFQRVLAVDPGHVNAILQLAQMAVEDKHGAEALELLTRLPETEKNDTATLVLQAQALALAGRCSELKELRGRIRGAGPSLRFALGTALATCREYADAEHSFSQALDVDPGNFDVLYNLGLAALRAGNTDRAVDVLNRALKLRPTDADCLFALAQAFAGRQELLDAAALLVRARTAAPQRADVVLFLAQVSARLQFYQDAATAYSDYLKLRPGDDAARRERGFAYARMAQPARALSDLEWYVRRHPRDATGWYELATAQTRQNEAEALKSLDRALALDSSLPEAHYTRAVLLLGQGHAERSIDDLNVVLKSEPSNPHVLTRLGQAYLATNRTAEALTVLKQAVDLAPADSGALLQYGRALQKLGRSQEASAVIGRLKQAAEQAPQPDEGLVAYLSLSPAAQRERYLANLRKTVAANPDRLDWKIRLADELFRHGDTTEAAALLGQVRAATSDPTLLADSGRILLDHEQYQAAQEFLAAAGKPARLDLAIAIFHTQGPEAALAELDKTAPEQRQGDYYLLRAELLDAMGKVEEAADSLNRGIRSAPTRPSLYLEAAGFLLKRELFRQALDLLDGATRLLPDARELFLAQAITLELLNRRDEERKLLDLMQARWPEWDRPYLLKGILLESQFQSAEARQALETAIALGANTPEAYYYLALAISHATPDDLAAAQDAIAHALKLTSSDPYVYLLAGRLALAKNDYPGAIEHLRQALRLSPRLIAAHDALRKAYSAMGNEERAAAEVQAMKQITDKAPDQNPLPVGNLLFSVHR